MATLYHYALDRPAPYGFTTLPKLLGTVGGLMLLAGFTGQFSLGHAAFLGVGAYAHAAFIGAGLPFVLSLALAAALSAAVGVIVGLPALRLKGIYLGIATLAFGFIVEEGLARWESVTGGNSGLHVKAIELFGVCLLYTSPSPRD